MAHIRRRKGGWQCIVRVQGYPPITKTFNTKIDAQRKDPDIFRGLGTFLHKKI